MPTTKLPARQPLGLASLVALAMAAPSCRSYDLDKYRDGDPNDELNSGIQGDYELPNPGTDDSVGVDDNMSGSGHAEAKPGGTLNVSLSFNAVNGNVVGGGIRFGNNGPVQAVSIPGAMGQGTGTLNFAVQIPPDICDDLSQICHDIKCYEFAVTDAGMVSKANINAVALSCGNCDEPSCQSLIDSCEVEDPTTTTGGGPSCGDILAGIDTNSGNGCIDNCAENAYDCAAANGCMLTSSCQNTYSNCLTNCY